ncbi:hypothetical protein PIB30_032801 [Stylosanthes scabra]|uniref:Coenzyme Q-binding protein COQ10 START domain-containing protein n=1 Tax=Stylosanthes scabra TaxID=79078 RepID=A0ABU6XC14_9FABA|nr:hypothetical protein [Stylosanthes scabra]
MPAFLSTAKALRSLASRRSGVGVAQLIRRSSYNKFDGCRCLTSIAGGATNQINPLGCRVAGSALSNSNAALQTRHFLGCGDGEEGVLSKIYEEKRVLGYSPEQLFDVVAAVDFYHGFVPWCQRSEILRHHPDGSFDAELEIGFKFLVESYVSHVELERPKRIKTTVSQSTLFDHLINVWEFNPGPVPGTCNLYFLVDFKFQSPLYRQIASMFFKEVASRMVGSFTERCRLIYGPEVRVHARSYGERT